MDETVGNLDTREIHQLIRELTIGVYSLNAQPLLSLEANVDLTSTCQLPTGNYFRPLLAFVFFFDCIISIY